ncbi:hypothetical protein A6A05_12870 [Magnetospirillum moscoviense]|uniref:Uncharacterized protein n=1 Tax=Magnetospirillum moscoviense TaxID=1437059 RepID=A0A178MMD5_9PROT|nr:hypothetical protein A6A05_12870 [Magnetospirillum moscoviense]
MAIGVAHQPDTATMAFVVDADIVQGLGDGVGDPAQIQVHDLASKGKAAGCIHRRYPCSTPVETPFSLGDEIRMSRG